MQNSVLGSSVRGGEAQEEGQYLEARQWYPGPFLIKNGTCSRTGALFMVLGIFKMGRKPRMTDNGLLSQSRHLYMVETDWIWLKQIKFNLNNSITENFMPVTLERWNFDRKCSSTYQALIQYKILVV